MKKYYVTYEAKDGDYTKVWCYAESKDDAEREVRGEYWDISEIVDIKEA